MENLYNKARAGDKKALNELIVRHGGLVKSIALRFTGRGTELEDLIQIGYEGLVKAVKRFDPDRGFCFSTYAVHLVMGEIRRFLRDDGAIKVSRAVKEQALAVRATSDALAKNFKREPTLNEIAEETGLKPDEIALAVSATSPKSLYETFSDETLVIDKIAADNINEADIVTKIAVFEIIGKENKRDRNLLYYRYFQDKTQAETARILGISQVQVSRIEKKLLKKIRGEL